MASSNFKMYLSDYTNVDHFDNLLKSIDSTNIIIVLHSSSTKLAVDLSNKYSQIKIIYSAGQSVYGIFLLSIIK